MFGLIYQRSHTNKESLWSIQGSYIVLCNVAITCQIDVYECRALVERYWQRKLKDAEKNLSQVNCPPHILEGLAWNITQAFVVKCHQPTAWAMALNYTPFIVSFWNPHPPICIFIQSLFSWWCVWWCGGTVGWGTALQAMSQVWFPLGL